MARGGLTNHYWIPLHYKLELFTVRWNISPRFLNFTCRIKRNCRGNPGLQMHSADKNNQVKKLTMQKDEDEPTPRKKLKPREPELIQLLREENMEELKGSREFLALHFNEIHGKEGLCQELVAPARAMTETRLLQRYGDYHALNLLKLKIAPLKGLI